MKRLFGTIATLSSLTLAACGAPTGGGGITAGGPGTVTLMLSNDDGNNAGGSNVANQLDEAKAIIHAVSVHVAGQGWIPLMEGRAEVDFLDLSASEQEIGVANIPAGKITQMRLYVLEDEDAYVVDDGERFPLLTPSGSQSGVKVIGLTDIEVGECEEAVLRLTTGKRNAIQIHGRGGDHGDYVLRPVIRADGWTVNEIEDCVPTGDPAEGEGEGEPGDDGDDEPGDEPGDDEPGDDGDDCITAGDGVQVGDDCPDGGFGEPGTDDGADPTGGDDGAGDPAGGGDDGAGGTDGSDPAGGDDGAGAGDPAGSGDPAGDPAGDVPGADPGTGDGSDLCYVPEVGFTPCG